LRSANTLGACRLILHVVSGLAISNLFSVGNFKMTQLAKVAPYECYLYVYHCASGEEFFREIKDDDLLDLETQVIHWVKDYFGDEVEVDLPIIHGIEGEYFASIKTDFNAPDSVISWESGGFYLK